MKPRPTPIVRCRVVAGELQGLRDRDQALYEAILEAHEGDEIEITIARHRPRTLGQNNYYRGVVVPLVAEEMGLSEDEAHAYLCARFLRTVRHDEPVIASTADLAAGEFSEFLEAIYQFAAEDLGLVIPSAQSAAELYPRLCRAG